MCSALCIAPSRAGDLSYPSPRRRSHQNSATILMRYVERILIGALVGLLGLPAATRAQVKQQSDSAAAPKPDVERRAHLARRGGGLRAGQWHLNAQQFPSGISASATPELEGYVRSGLDLHLVMENSVGVWRQRQVTSASGGLLGSSSGTVDNYIIPQYTSIVFYPLTAPNDRLEPFVRGGLGFALGVSDPQGGSGGISFTPGFGTTGGLGIEWRATDALGLSLSGRYQWIRFFQEFAGFQTYQGPALEAGVTYRFQYR